MVASSSVLFNSFHALSVKRDGLLAVGPEGSELHYSHIKTSYPVFRALFETRASLNAFLSRTQSSSPSC